MIASFLKVHESILHLESNLQFASSLICLQIHSFRNSVLDQNTNIINNSIVDPSIL